LFPSNIAGTWKSITATLQAMERAGVIRTLAEPNLTAISGESANFLAGGEFPIPAGYTCAAPTIGLATACQYSIQWTTQFHAGRHGRRTHQPQGHY
jgi:pilus assembly protein CpaC